MDLVREVQARCDLKDTLVMPIAEVKRGKLEELEEIIKRGRRNINN